MRYYRLTSTRQRSMIKLVNFSYNSYYVILLVVFLFLCVILSEYLQIHPIQPFNSYEPSYLLSPTELFKNFMDTCRRSNLQRAHDSEHAAMMDEPRPREGQKERNLCKCRLQVLPLDFG